ncbi:MAG: DUF2283 domain-containing protein [Bosea sp. (in: a-proteobacteria)]
MKVTFDAEADAVHVLFSNDKIVESEEVHPGIVFDFDAAGHIVAIELLDAREQLTAKTIADLQAAE